MDEVIAAIILVYIISVIIVGPILIIDHEKRITTLENQFEIKVEYIPKNKSGINGK